MLHSCLDQNIGTNVLTCSQDVMLHFTINILPQLIVKELKCFINILFTVIMLPSDQWTVYYII